MAVGTAWVLLLSFAAYYRVRPWPDILLHIDFSSFWMAATMLRDGAGPALFDVETQYAFQLGLRQNLGITEEIRRDMGYNPYPNPPALALLYLPLTLLPIPWAYLLWWGISLSAFAAAIALPLRGHPLGRSTALLMLSFVGVTTTLFEGQPYGLFLLAFSLGLVALRSGSPFLGGVLLGLLWLKPQYAAIFPLVFLAKGSWRELAGMAASGLMVAALSLVLVGPSGILAWLQLLREIGGFHYPWVDPWAMTNWRGVVANLWPTVPEETGSALVLGLGGVTLLLSFAAWRGSWDPNSPRFPRQVLVAVLATILASPHSHIHGAVFLLPVVALMLCHPVKGAAQERAWKPLLLAGYALSLAIWPFGLARWALVPFLMGVLGLSVFQCWRYPGFRSVPAESRADAVTQAGQA